MDISKLSSLKVAVTRRDKELYDDPDSTNAGQSTKVVAVPVREITSGKPAGLDHGEHL